MLFRKPPTDQSNGYADVPVVKSKDDYSLARWQVDAHGFMRSSGNRLLDARDLAGLPHDVIYKLWKAESTTQVYDYDRHVSVGDQLQQAGRLPVTFMLIPPHSWHPDVWADVARMRTLNMLQEKNGREMHLCPLQFDIVDRTITQFTMPGETVFDPFGGIMTVAYCALKLGRKALSTELSESYYTDGLRYVQQAVRERSGPSLFDLMECEDMQEKAS